MADVRPIDAYAFMAVLKDMPFYTWADYEKVIWALLNAPTLEVATERNGKWIISSDGYYPYCSECGFRPDTKMTAYCGGCGAKMRR